MVTTNFHSINHSGSAAAPNVGVVQNCNPGWPDTDQAVVHELSSKSERVDLGRRTGDAMVSVFASELSLPKILPLVSQQHVQVCHDWQHAMEAFLAGQGGCIFLELDQDAKPKLEQVRQSRCQWNLLTVVACSADDSGAMAMTAARSGCQDFVSFASFGSSASDNQASDARHRIQNKIQQACLLDMEGTHCRQQFRANWKTLSLRERDVLRRCIDGDNSKSLAKQLAVTYQTIDKHRNRALRKMNCNSLIEFSTLLHQLQSIEG